MRRPLGFATHWNSGHYFFYSSNFAYILKDGRFAPNAPISHLCVSHDKNVQNVHIWGVTNAHLGGPNAPKSHVGMSNDPKLPKKNQTFFVPNATKSHLQVYNDQDFHFLCPKSAKNWKKLPQKSNFFSPKINLEVSNEKN